MGSSFFFYFMIWLVLFVRFEIFKFLFCFVWLYCFEIDILSLNNEVVFFYLLKYNVYFFLDIEVKFYFFSYLSVDGRRIEWENVVLYMVGGGGGRFVWKFLFGIFFLCFFYRFVLFWVSIDYMYNYSNL